MNPETDRGTVHHARGFERVQVADRLAFQWRFPDLLLLTPAFQNLEPLPPDSLGV
ncbi:MAG: hypothetical protein ACOCY6_02655 [Halodesulfurarchaeum sp.]